MNRQETFERLNQQLKDIPKSQIRSISLSVLPRLMGALYKSKGQCIECERFSKKGDVFVNDIKPLFAGDKEYIKDFEYWVEESQIHLKKDHGQQVRGRITSVYTTIGIITGTIFATAYCYFTKQTGYIGCVVLGWTIGMVAGYLGGKITERYLVKNNKLY